MYFLRFFKIQLNYPGWKAGVYNLNIINCVMTILLSFFNHCYILVSITLKSQNPEHTHPKLKILSRYCFLTQQCQYCFIPGEYECTLKSDEIYFYQMGQIDIKDAPIIQTKTEINTKCVPGNNQPLECCVQTPYKLMWKEGDVELLTSKCLLKVRLPFQYDKRPKK